MWWGFGDNRIGYIRDRHELLWAHRGENFCHCAGGGEDSEGFSKRGDFSQFLKMVRICKAGNKGMGREEREGEVLAICVVFALKSSTHAKAGLLPLQKRWYLSLCTKFPSTFWIWPLALHLLTGEIYWELALMLPYSHEEASGQIL